MISRLLALDTFGIKLGLENITRLCAALGNPQRQFPSLHIAGTNGKGSVTAMAHAALVAAGVRVARFTSPHLVDLAERFVIGDRPVDPHELERVANDVLDCADALHARGELSVLPTFFEATTAIAFELFRRARVEVAVIEVGLGGRFDSTNILAPPVGAITSIGLDHQQYLGDTVEAIAFEKAGIIKPGMTMVTGALPDAARRVVVAVAAERGAHVVDAWSGVRIHRDLRDGRATVDVETPDDWYGPVTLALRGEHQVGNALVAIRLLEASRVAGLSIPRRAIEQGLSGVAWPARLEIVPVSGSGGKQVILDAAHNVDGAEALAAYLSRWHPERLPLVIGVMRDKDVEGMIDRLLPAVSSIVATAASTPRAMPPEELAARARSRVPGNAVLDVRAEADPVLAVEQALARHDVVCVAGSIFLAGEVRDALERRAILR
ncbi:MAG: bifunctional folylpolyglutamate synthase/dihydrofolate synthase [Acidobacteria bacterium]|nr:bifunctional folylpolyglutamate synthase/dihydrofolate synthase [Acidobacteriota bacterium]